MQRPACRHSQKSFGTTPLKTAAESGPTSLSTSPPGRSPFSFAVQFVDGNFAAAFTLDRIAGTNDSHRCRQYRSWLFAQIARSEGAFASHASGTRPRRRRIFQDFL